MALIKINKYLAAIQKQFSKAEKKAVSLAKDKDKTLKTLNTGFKRAYARKKELSSIWTQLKLLFELVKDYVSGNYTSIPYRSILSIFAGIIYFISPLDAIPDVILGFGFIDDIFVLSLIIKQLEHDLKLYEAWKLTR